MQVMEFWYKSRNDQELWRWLYLYLYLYLDWRTGMRGVWCFLRITYVQKNEKRKLVVGREEENKKVVSCGSLRLNFTFSQEHVTE